MLILMTCFFIQHNNEQTVFSHMEIDPKTLTISVMWSKIFKKKHKQFITVILNCIHNQTKFRSVFKNYNIKYKNITTKSYKKMTV